MLGAGKDHVLNHPVQPGMFKYLPDNRGACVERLCHLVLSRPNFPPGDFLVLKGSRSLVLCLRHDTGPDRTAPTQNDSDGPSEGTYTSSSC